MPSLFELAQQKLRLFLTEQGLESTVTPTLFRVRLLAVGIAISHGAAIAQRDLARLDL